MILNKVRLFLEKLLNLNLREGCLDCGPTITKSHLMFKIKGMNWESVINQKFKHFIKLYRLGKLKKQQWSKRKTNIEFVISKK